MPDEPGAAGEGQRELLARLRAVVEANDAEIGVLRRELDAERELRRRLGLRLAALERRLGMDSSDSGTPPSKERIGAKEARRARRQESERERRKDRRRGGQPGHPGKGLERDPDPGEPKDADRPAECRRCRTGLDGAGRAEPGWAQVWDVEILRTVTEWALPGPGVPVLRDGHDRGSAAGRARGLGVVRAGAERGGGAADLLRERTGCACRCPRRDSAGHSPG